MKTYYCVATTIYDGGRVVCNLIDSVTAERKPENVYNPGSRADRYLDYFDTKEEAEQYIEQSKTT